MILGMKIIYNQLKLLIIRVSIIFPFIYTFPFVRKCVITADVILVGTHTGTGYMGQNTTQSDVNGDGFDDVIVGTSSSDMGGGRIYVFHVGTNGVETTPSTTIRGPSGANLGMHLTQ